MKFSLSNPEFGFFMNEKMYVILHHIYSNFKRLILQPNYIKQVFYFCLFIVAILLIFSNLNNNFWENWQLKKIDILADIRKDSTLPKAVKTSSKAQKNKAIEPIWVGFEDFTENKNGLKLFANALANIKLKKQKVRIGFFGDSFIEGDMLTADIRDSLQYKYGGKGVGFVPITSSVAGFRGTVLHEFENFESYSAVGKRVPNVLLGIAGTCDIPLENNKLHYTLPYRNKAYDYFSKANLFYSNFSTDSIDFKYVLNDSEKKAYLTPGMVGSYQFESKYARNLSFEFSPNKNLNLYGVSFETNEGIYLDNFGMRGNSGVGLGYVNAKIYKAFDAKLHYNLIVLQYGLNALSEKDTNTSWYEKSMNITIKNIKQAFPNAAILLVSVSDRGTKINGKVVTVPNIFNFVNMQRKLAQQNKILFWNMFEAMGGEGTMAKWVNAKKPLANKDYTHLTFRGGKQLASLFCNALITEVNKYEKTK